MNTTDPSAMTDAELDAELAELGHEDEELRRVKRRFKSDAHDTVERSVGTARQMIGGLLAGTVYDLAHSGGQAMIPTGIGDVWVLANRPEVEAAWHAAIDEASAGPEPGAIFGPMDRPAWEAARAQINDRSAALVAEQGLRRARLAMAEAERELAEMEAKA